MGKYLNFTLGVVLTFGSGVFADDAEIAAMKATIAKMQAEMERRDAAVDNLQAELQQLRSKERDNAGGEPAKLLTANGKAKLRIGGEVRIRYGTGWTSGYNRTTQGTNDRHANYRSQYAGWAISRAEMRFDFDLSADTSARLGIRYSGDSNGSFDANGLINEAWWKWKNIGGSGLALTAGYQYMPFGMGNSKSGGFGFSSTANGIITTPLVLRVSTDIINRPGAINDMENALVERDYSTLGLIASYRFLDEQIIVQGGIMASPINIPGRSVSFNNPGVNTANELRNIGLVNHLLNVAYNPCWFEGLHFEASYLGEFDAGMGYDPTNNTIISDPYAPQAVNYDANHGEHVYRPSFDLAAYYKAAKWQAYGEMVMTFNPGYRDGLGYALTFGADYNLTHKLMISGEVDYLHYADGGSRSPLCRLYNQGVSDIDLLRLTCGMKYDFNNGIFAQMQYLHDFLRACGVGDANWRNQDAVIFQTGYKF